MTSKTAKLERQALSAALCATPIKTRKPSWRWQTRATRKHDKNCSEVMQQPSAPSGEWHWRI